MDPPVPDPYPGQWIYLNLGYRLSSMEGPASRVLGPIGHAIDGCMVEFTMTIEDPEAGEENYTPEELAHFRLYRPLMDSTDTAVFSSSTPKPIEELCNNYFGENMVYVGMLHDILRIVPYAERSATPSSTSSAHEDTKLDPSVYEPIPADPSDEVTKALVQKLGLLSDVPVYTLYFVSQTYVNDRISGLKGGKCGQLMRTTKANVQDSDDIRQSPLLWMDGEFPPRRHLGGQSQGEFSPIYEVNDSEFWTGG